MSFGINELEVGVNDSIFLGMNSKKCNMQEFFNEICNTKICNSEIPSIEVLRLNAIIISQNINQMFVNFGKQNLPN